MKRMAHAFSLLLGLALLASPAQAQDPQPMTLDGPLGSFTERRPAPTAFDSEAHRQRQLRIATMTAMSGLYRTLVTELTRDPAEVAFRRTAAAALAETAALLPAAFSVESPAPEGETGALLLIWDEASRAAFDDLIASFHQATEELRTAAVTGEDFEAKLYAARYYCIASHSTYRSR